MTREIHDGSIQARLDKAIGCGDQRTEAVVHANAMSESVKGMRMRCSGCRKDTSGIKIDKVKKDRDTLLLGK